MTAEPRCPGWAKSRASATSASRVPGGRLPSGKTLRRAYLSDPGGLSARQFDFATAVGLTGTAAATALRHLFLQKLVEPPDADRPRLAEASLSPNTRRAYSGALRRFDAWLDGRRLEDATLAAYLAELHDLGRGCGQIARMLNAAAKYSRSTSRIFRMDNLLFASSVPSCKSREDPTPAGLSRVAQPRLKVIGLDRNR